MQALNNTLTGTKETSYLSKVWSSIESMPIHNWIKILETGDLKYLFKKSKGRVTQRIDDHWVDLQQEYIDEFGLEEGYKQQMRLKKKLLLLNIELTLTKERHLLNIIKITEADLSSDNQKKALKFYEMLDHVEKYKGFSIDPYKTSVVKWYYSLKNMGSNGKAN